MFQVETEARLKKKSCTEQDRKYMVQTLATMMSHNDDDLCAEAINE